MSGQQDPQHQGNRHPPARRPYNNIRTMLPAHRINGYRSRFWRPPPQAREPPQDPAPRPERTRDSLVFGIRARDIRSRNAWSWSREQVQAVWNWLHGNRQINELYEYLELDGFDPEILDADGKPVYKMIDAKVTERVRRMRRDIRAGREYLADTPELRRVPLFGGPRPHLPPHPYFPYPGVSINIIDPESDAEYDADVEMQDQEG
ncbi:hypothetical protein F4808DRAFT_123375 [Astrocystis sublimbata]|nr:hypothetical protein F4808DRAFT_123375 [Astrocystis sublimbata]